MTTKIVQKWSSITLSSYVRRIMMNNALTMAYNRFSTATSVKNPYFSLGGDSWLPDSAAWFLRRRRRCGNYFFFCQKQLCDNYVRMILSQLNSNAHYDCYGHDKTVCRILHFVQNFTLFFFTFRLENFTPGYFFTQPAVVMVVTNIK